MPNNPDKSQNPSHPTRHYILRIKEHLASNWSEEYEGLKATYTDAGETLLCGDIADQAALHGLLARIRDLNLTLISINPVTNQVSDGEKVGYDNL